MTKLKEKKKSSAPSKKYAFYDANGKKTRKECPKCGRGIFLGEHKNPARLVCGKCSYTEFTNK